MEVLDHSNHVSLFRFTHVIEEWKPEQAVAYTFRHGTVSRLSAKSRAHCREIERKVVEDCENALPFEVCYERGPCRKPVI